jgi:hypothetical protein
MTALGQQPTFYLNFLDRLLCEVKRSVNDVSAVTWSVNGSALVRLQPVDA